MNYLVDTHVLLWYFNDSVNLSETALNVIEDINCQKFINIASLWEFSIKLSIGKLRFEGGLRQLLEIVEKNGFIVQPITQSHLSGIIDLPFIHRDPFDRLLIAAAKTDDMTLLTDDENILKYDVQTYW